MAHIGRSTPRREDRRLITGRGRYANDVQPADALHVTFCRSTMPHARIRAIDRSAVTSMPGVVAVLTAEDLPQSAAGLSDFGPPDLEQRGRPILSRDEVNYAGEAYALVVAESRYEAQDAAEALLAELEPLPGVAGVLNAIAGGAPVVHADMKSNIASTSPTAFGDIKAAFGDGAIVAKVRLMTDRVAGAAMEPRCVTALYDAETNGLRVWTSTQNIFGVRNAIASAVALPEDRVRVMAEDVGGGFGAKGMVFAEEVLIALVAWRLKRPVTWTATRSEDGMTTAQAHGSVMELEIAADREGKLRGLRGRLIHDIGAYAGSGAGQPGIIISHMVSAYVLPAMHVEAVLAYTNTLPTGFIRGGGRPLGNFAMERAMDALAHELEMDPVELRRRNLIAPEQVPYTTGLPGGRAGVVYDSGDYPKLLDLAIEKIGKKPASADGRLIGLGVACCVESTAFGRGEPARVRLEKDGVARIFVGSTPGGQGHETMAALVAADRLGWPLEKIQVTAGDTGNVPFALLTAGSRSAVQVGNATARAATAMRKQLLDRGAEVLEADSADLVIEDGAITVRGTPTRRVPVSDVIPEDGLEVLETFDPARPLTFSSGCHAALVAVDPETGHVDVLRYVIAHDTGKAINPLTLEGQLVGGYAHGLGYALFESAIYDADGTPRTASFLDYSIVSTGEVSAPELAHIETPTDSNPEGFKGAGESGTIPAPATIAAAVEDALRQRKPGVVVDRLPMSPDRIVELLAN